MAGILCLNGFLGMGITMTNESLEQRIAKQEERLKQQEERLKQLKAQKQAKDAREKAKQKEQDRKTIPDVKFYWVLTCSRKWKMKQRNKKYSLASTSI